MHMWASQVALVVKNPPANAGDIRNVGSIPGSGRSPGGGHGYPLQYSYLENSMDGGAQWARVHMDRGGWWARVHRVAKSRTQLKPISTALHRHITESLCYIPETSTTLSFTHTLVANEKLEYMYMCIDTIYILPSCYCCWLFYYCCCNLIGRQRPCQETKDCHRRESQKPDDQCLQQN